MPEGVDWPHEVKFDGWRVQLHVEGGRHALPYERHGLHKALSSLKPMIERRRLSACFGTGASAAAASIRISNRYSLRWRGDRRSDRS